MRSVLVILLLPALLSAADSPQHRIQQLTRIPGFVALWDFVARHPTTRNFTAITAPGDSHDFSLLPINYVREFWNAGRPASLDDFPLLNSGPFGQAILIRPEADPDFRPVLLVPRANLHDSSLDVKGPGQSVTLIAWVIRQSGNHAIAGIWHEGTDLQHQSTSTAATRVEPGMRQYALFAGLAANNGASAAHVSENGRNSFGDRYARNLSVTPDLIPSDSWSVVAMVYDNRRRTVTSYLNGKAGDHWIENPEKHPFFQWPAKAWGCDYLPPESKPRKRKLLAEDAATRTELHHFDFTRVRVTLDRRTRKVTHRQLVALRVNPFYFNHDLYSPPSPSRGGPFTIGRVIHSGRSVGFTGYIGGVAVFHRALSPAQMRRIARIAPNPLPAP